MARKTKEVTITADTAGTTRDHGKTFIITEMPASQAEAWAARVLFAMGRSGVQAPPGIESAGFLGVAILGLRAVLSLDWQDAKPLMDEMMTCVAVKGGPGGMASRPLVEDADIEEVATRYHLRREVFDLHSDFSSLVGRFLSEVGQKTGES